MDKNIPPKTENEILKEVFDREYKIGNKTTEECVRQAISLALELGKSQARKEFEEMIESRIKFLKECLERIEERQNALYDYNTQKKIYEGKLKENEELLTKLKQERVGE